jgi:speckle-type POZ protein
MLESTSGKEITISNFSYKTFMSILTYLYTDAVEITLETAMELFEAAGFFCIERLKNICEQMILSSIDSENVANILQASDVHNAQNLRDAAMRYIINNFDKVSRTESFQEMARANVELVLEILAKR